MIKLIKKGVSLVGFMLVSGSCDAVLCWDIEVVGPVEKTYFEWKEEKDVDHLDTVISNEAPSDLFVRWYEEFGLQKNETREKVFSISGGPTLAKGNLVAQWAYSKTISSNYTYAWGISNETTIPGESSGSCGCPPHSPSIPFQLHWTYHFNSGFTEHSSRVVKKIFSYHAPGSVPWYGEELEDPYIINQFPCYIVDEAWAEETGRPVMLKDICGIPTYIPECGPCNPTFQDKWTKDRKEIFHKAQSGVNPNLVGTLKEVNPNVPRKSTCKVGCP